MDLVIPVVGGVLQGQQAAMEVKEGDLAGKGIDGTGRGDDADLARQAAMDPGDGLEL